jgi:hypothetical protein
VNFEQYDKHPYGSVIYVSEDVFCKLMETNYQGSVTFEGDNPLFLRGINFVEIKDLPENTIITPKPEEVERLQKERFDKTMVDLENFNSMLEDCR